MNLLRLPTDGRSIGIPYLNNTLGEDHSRRNLNVDRSLAFSSLSSVNINSSSNPNNHPPISNELPLPPPSRLSEPLQHSWVLSGLAHLTLKLSICSLHCYSKYK